MNSGDRRLTGIIKSWDDAKGFGFIELKGQRKDVFFHISALETHRTRPEVGDEVIYILEEGSGKRPRAEAVWLRGEPAPEVSGLQRASQKGLLWRLSAFPLFIAACTAIHLRWGLDGFLIIWQVIASAVCFSLYGWDKTMAWNGKRRVPESALLGWGLIGGWPGGLLAQVIFWHKTTKASFQRSFWLTVGLSVVLTALVSSIPMSVH